MKLAVSNIAWDSGDMGRHLEILSETGCSGLELAPSKIWDEPVNISDNEYSKFKKNVSNYGLEIPSLHSLTYTRPDLHFFKGEQIREKLISYIKKLIEKAYILDCQFIVFGSASCRDTGGLDREYCKDILIDSFYELASYAEKYNVNILIEYLSKKFTDCINTPSEAWNLVNCVNHPFFNMHVDLRTSIEIGEDIPYTWQRYHNKICHCHVSDPDLKIPSEKYNEHYIAARSMKKTGYSKYISIEMREIPGETEKNLFKAIDFIKKVYL